MCKIKEKLVIQTVVTKETFDWICQNAEKAGLSRSAYVQMLLKKMVAGGLNTGLESRRYNPLTGEVGG